MHTEIMHASSFDYKEGLKVKRDSLNRILSSLKKQPRIEWPCLHCIHGIGLLFLKETF